MLTNDGRTECVIFDIDGTLADVAHRLHILTETPKNWDAFFAACCDDAVHAATARLFYWIRDIVRLPVFDFSSRPERTRALTEEWLKKNDLMPVHVFLRKDKDHRPDPMVKRQMLDELTTQGFRPIFVVDDRPDVVRMWRENGIPCFCCDDRQWFKHPVDGKQTTVEWLKWMEMQHAEPMFRKVREEVEALHRQLKLAQATLDMSIQRTIHG